MTDWSTSSHFVVSAEAFAPHVFCEHSNGKLSLSLVKFASPHEVMLRGTPDELHSLTIAIRNALADHAAVAAGLEAIAPLIEAPAPRCWCENRSCLVCRADGCENPPSDKVRCDYIGAICDACAEYMPADFLHPIEGADNNKSEVTE